MLKSLDQPHHHHHLNCTPPGSSWDQLENGCLSNRLPQLAAIIRTRPPNNHVFTHFPKLLSLIQPAVTVLATFLS